MSLWKKSLHRSVRTCIGICRNACTNQEYKSPVNPCLISSWSYCCSRRGERLKATVYCGKTTQDGSIESFWYFTQGFPAMWQMFSCNVLWHTKNEVLSTPLVSREIEQLSLPNGKWVCKVANPCKPHVREVRDENETLVKLSMVSPKNKNKLIGTMQIEARPDFIPRRVSKPAEKCKCKQKCSKSELAGSRTSCFDLGRIFCCKQKGQKQKYHDYSLPYARHYNAFSQSPTPPFNHLGPYNAFGKGPPSPIETPVCSFPTLTGKPCASRHQRWSTVNPKPTTRPLLTSLFTPWRDLSMTCGSPSTLQTMADQMIFILGHLFFSSQKSVTICKLSAWPDIKLFPSLRCEIRECTMVSGPIRRVVKRCQGECKASCGYGEYEHAHFRCSVPGLVYCCRSTKDEGGQSPPYIISPCKHRCSPTDSMEHGPFCGASGSVCCCKQKGKKIKNYNAAVSFPERQFPPVKMFPATIKTLGTYYTPQKRENNNS
ncbi:hypothetical protein JRQ81_005257 [Phrynocephalus forsythii]|uniref:Uncharacterized protein n=1 Tax=Phrynocephalus forsythii TaxID=171643 RepID=A0A9Q0Y2R2_9SAUR|nr:hypothetical protein JRQ81_005257 [Phrynocephalus forsythii]